MNSQNSQVADAVNSVSKDESKTVRMLFTSLLLTVKNLSLYPPGHTICTNSVNQFHSQLTTFLEKQKALKLEIERDRIICQGEIVSEGVPEEGTLHYTFFRDGIRWFEFVAGVEQQELTDIFLLINMYTKLSAEPDGDIVTAFWEIQFPHMNYEVAELLWGDEQGGKDFSDLISGRSTLIQSADPEYRETEYPDDPPIDMDKVLLNPEEEAALQEMIRMEEDSDRTSYLDALLDSLLQNREELNFTKITDAFVEEFLFSLAQRDFLITYKILSGMQYVLDIFSGELPWAEKLIKEFFQKVSSVEYLAPLNDVWEHIVPDDATVLQDIFTLLDPMAIRMPLSLLSRSQAAPQRKMLLDLIILLASRDTRSLEMALNNTNENLLERLIPVIVKMEDGQVMKYLLKLSRHPSGRVRYGAVKGILKYEPDRIRDMLELIEDEEDSIRQLVLEHMGQSQDDAVESFLISYIKKNKSGEIDANYIIQCFRMLGRCGSLHSIPFLQETLLKWGFLSGSRRSVLRRGAAIALGTLGTTQAEAILERAGRSLFPGVRGAVMKGRLELGREADGNV